ncbi:MAG: hypothetical protein AB9834_23810 [Lentimicrobium sp.]
MKNPNRSEAKKLNANLLICESANLLIKNPNRSEAKERNANLPVRLAKWINE